MKTGFPRKVSAYGTCHGATLVRPYETQLGKAVLTQTMKVAALRFCFLNLALISRIFVYREREMKRSSQIEKDTNGVHLWVLLWKATKAVEAHARRSVNGTELGLSDFGVLEALLHKGPLPINVLGKKVLLSSGSMTAAVDRLEKSGYVERATISSDRRACIVHLTEEGSKLIRRVFAQHELDMERVFSLLDTSERKALANLLRKLGREAERTAVEEKKPVGKK
jgi:MarR family transcriptional regulator, 2-MHQ and catechol-resistance regulon repressor